MHLTRATGRKAGVRTFPGRLKGMAAALLLWTAGTVCAAPIPWQSQKFEYVADRKDIKEVLRDLGASHMQKTPQDPFRGPKGLC